MHKVSMAFCALLPLGSGRLTWKKRLAKFFSLLQVLDTGRIFVRNLLEGVFARLRKKPFHFAVEGGCKAWACSSLLLLPLRKAALPEWRCCLSWDWSDDLRLLTWARVVALDSHHTAFLLMILLMAEARISLVLFSHVVILQRQFQHWWIFRIRSSAWIILSFQMTFSFCCLHQRQGILCFFVPVTKGVFHMRSDFQTHLSHPSMYFLLLLLLLSFWAWAVRCF